MKKNLILEIFFPSFKKKIKELEEKNQKATKKIAELERLLAIIAHDLRSPFNSFLGLTELLASDHEIPIEKQKQHFKAANIQAENTFNMLTSLLNWARIQIGQNPVSLLDFNLKEVVDNVINLLQKNALEKQISIINKVPSNIFVLADTDITEIVIRNLVSNAIKFSLKDGVIIISKIVVGSTLKVSITDTGVGIKPDNLKRLFSSEIQSTLGTNNEKGSGIGLMFCRDLIEKQGGKIWATSNSKGSTFTFTLKLAKK